MGIVLPTMNEKAHFSFQLKCLSILLKHVPMKTGTGIQDFFY